VGARIAIFNQKGGTGKTAVTGNLAGALAELGKSVLVIDLDGQASLTRSLGLREAVYVDEGDNIYTMLTTLQGDPHTLIQRAPHDTFDILPGHYMMFEAAESLVAKRNREGRLSRILKTIRKPYDYILVDCPPQRGAISDNALLACRRVLVPAEMHEAYMDEVSGLFRQVRALEGDFDIQIGVVGIVPVAYRGNPDEAAYLEALRQYRAEWVAPCLRYRRSLMNHARVTGHSIFSYKPPASHRAKAQRESQADHLALAKFVMQRVEGEAS